MNKFKAGDVVRLTKNGQLALVRSYYPNLFFGRIGYYALSLMPPYENKYIVSHNKDCYASEEEIELYLTNGQKLKKRLGLDNE